MTVKQPPAMQPKVHPGQTAPTNAAPTEEAMKQVMVATGKELKKAKKALEQNEGFGWIGEQEAEQTEAMLSDQIDEQVPGYGERLFEWLRERLESR